MKPSSIAWFVAAAALLLSGCVRERVEGETSTFEYEWWVPLAGYVGALAAAAFGVWSVTREGWTARLRGAVVLVVAGFFGLWGVPWICYEHVVVSPDKFVVHRYSQNAKIATEVRFADLERIALTRKQEKGRKGRIVDVYYFDCYAPDDRLVASVRLSEFMDFSAKAEDGGAVGRIVERARAAGVEFVDLSP